MSNYTETDESAIIASVPPMCPLGKPVGSDCSAR